MSKAAILIFLDFSPYSRGLRATQKATPFLYELPDLKWKFMRIKPLSSATEWRAVTLGDSSQGPGCLRGVL